MSKRLAIRRERLLDRPPSNLWQESDGRKRRRRRLHSPARPLAKGDVESPALPRITHLMALAIKLDRMLRDGVIQDYSELARLGHVSRTRVSQIMSLLQLAPDLQEELLFLAPAEQGRDAITEPLLRKVARLYNWDEQRWLFGQLALHCSAPLAAPVRRRRALSCPGLSASASAEHFK